MEKRGANLCPLSTFGSAILLADFSDCQCQSRNSPGFNPDTMESEGRQMKESEGRKMKESEGRQMKQFWIKYLENLKNSPFLTLMTMQFFVCRENAQPVIQL